MPPHDAAPRFEGPLILESIGLRSGETIHNSKELSRESTELSSTPGGHRRVPPRNSGSSAGVAQGEIKWGLEYSLGSGCLFKRP